MIRSASPHDLAAIGKIAERAYRHYLKDLGRPPAPMVADFARHVDRDWVIVFAEDTAIAGYAILIIDDGRALLDNIAVDPKHQGIGVGRTLVDHVERHVAALGFEALDLYTNVVMTANITWYEKLGFMETRRIEEHGFHRVYMRKALALCSEG